MSVDILEVKKRLNVFFKNDHNLINKYLELYGPVLNIKHINAIREDYSNIENKNTQPTNSESNADEGYDPLFQTKLKCPVCKLEGIQGNELRAKSQIVFKDQFETPIYRGTNGFRTCNYSLYSITVCPKCLFASPDKKDFMWYKTSMHSYQESQLSARTLSDLIDTIGERLTIFEDFQDKHLIFQHPRSWNTAILTYKLALERVKVELRTEEFYALYKQGSYWSKIALLERQNNVDDESSLEMALTSFKEAYLKSDFPSPNLEFQTCYVIYKILLRFDQTKEARDYLGSMERIKTELENEKKRGGGSDSLGSLLKWIQKAKEFWEDREQDDIWNIPKGPR